MNSFKDVILIAIINRCNFGKGNGWIIGVDLSGQVKYNLQDWSGSYSGVTSVNEIGGRLFLGSINMHTVGAIDPPE